MEAYYYYYYYYYTCYHLYARYVQLYTSNKPCLYGIQCCSCSVCTVCATCNVNSTVQYVAVPLHQHFPQSVCSAQYGCCLQFLDFVLNLYVAQVLSEVILRRFQSPPVITGITLAFTFHMRWISIVSIHTLKSSHLLS